MEFVFIVPGCRVRAVMVVEPSQIDGLLFAVTVIDPDETSILIRYVPDVELFAVQLG